MSAFRPLAMSKPHWNGRWSRRHRSLKTGRRWLWLAAAALVIGALNVWAVAHFHQPTPADRVFRLEIIPPERSRFVALGNTVGGSALSPDGRMVAFVAAINGKT